MKKFLALVLLLAPVSAHAQFAYGNNGLGFRLCYSPCTLGAGEVFFSSTPTTQQLTDAFPGYTAAAAAVAAQGTYNAAILAGLGVTSTGTPALNATYALDQTTLDQIGSVARDAAAGLGLPGGGGTFIYPDASGTPHSFSSANVQDLYKAMRDYMFELNTTLATIQAGGQANWPEASVTIQ